MSDYALSPLGGILAGFLQAKQLQEQRESGEQQEQDRQRQQAEADRQFGLQQDTQKLAREKFEYQKTQDDKDRADADKKRQAQQDAILNRDYDGGLRDYLKAGGTDPLAFQSMWGAAHGLRDPQHPLFGATMGGGGQQTAGQTRGTITPSVQAMREQLALPPLAQIMAGGGGVGVATPGNTPQVAPVGQPAAAPGAGAAVPTGLMQMMGAGAPAGAPAPPAPMISGNTAANNGGQTPNTAANMGGGPGGYQAPPGIQAKIDLQHSQQAVNAAKVPLEQAQTKKILDLLPQQVQNLISQWTDRDLLAKETVTHHRNMEGLRRSAQALRDRLSERTEYWRQQGYGQRERFHADMLKDHQDARFRQALSADKAQAVTLRAQAVKERDGLIAEGAKVDTVLGMPAPTKAAFADANGVVNEGKYASAVAAWHVAVAHAQERQKQIGQRIKEIDAQIKGLNKSIDQARQDLMSAASVTDADGTTNAAATRAAHRQGAPNLSFRVEGDRPRVNPDLIGTVSLAGEQAGLGKITVGTAISGHSADVIIHGRDTGRRSLHAAGRAMDLSGAVGADGKFHPFNVNDPAGNKLARQLAARIAQTPGARVIYGVDNDAVGNHKDHIHIEWHPGEPGRWIGAPGTASRPGRKTAARRPAHKPYSQMSDEELLHSVGAH